MHVCIATHDCETNTGGVNSWVMRLLRELKRRNWGTSCLIYSSCPENRQGTLEQFLFDHNVPYRRTKYERYMEENVRWTCSSVQSLHPDVFVTNSMVPAWYSAPQLEAAGIPCIGVNHSDDPFYHALADHCVAKDGWFQLSGLVAVSKYLEDKTMEIAGPRTSIARIPCGIDATEPTIISQAAANRTDSKFRIAYAGRFVEEQKRVTRVAQCICAAAKRHQNVEGYFIGTGPSETSIQSIIHETGTGDQVHVVGWLHADDVTTRLASMNAIALLSDYEGLPIVLMEAMSVGLVPICTRMKSGVDELIRDGENGLFVEPTMASFSEAVDALLESTEFRDRLSTNAQYTIRGEYVNSICTDRWMDVIQTVVREFERPILTAEQNHLPQQHPNLTSCDQRRPTLSQRIGARAKRLKRSVIKRIRKDQRAA